jgi:hypothetical protein
MLIRHLRWLLVAMSLTGCGIGSVVPLVTDAGAEQDARLVGSWRDSSGKESVVISDAGSRRYSLVYTGEDGKVGRFEARLGHMGALRILDVVPETPKFDASDVYLSLLLPLHAPLVIDSVGAEIRYRMFEPDSMKNYLTRQPGLVAHQLVDDYVVFTGSAAATTAFLASIARRPGALTEQGVFRRR